VIPARASVMRRIISWSLDFRFLVIAAAVALIIAGIATLPSSPVDVFPQFAPPQVEIQTESLGLSTSDVERLVTVPIELAMSGMPGLADMRSTSVPQLSSIILVFKPGSDLLHARQLVQERLTTVRPTLPRWASPPVMLAPVSATGRVLQIGMWSNTYSIEELSRLAYWTIKARLLRVDGVADVSIWNERQPTLQVQVDPLKMSAHDVTLDNVELTTADALDSGALQFSTGAVVGAGGFVEVAGRRLQVVHTLSIQTARQLADVPLEEQPNSTRTLRLADVGRVVVGHQPIIGDAVIDGRPGLLLVVEKLPWGNTLKVTQGVQAALKSMQPGMTGVHFDTTIFRPASFIETSLHNLRDAMLLGFLFVVVIVVLFLFEWRVALISVVTLPLSLVAAALVLRLAGATINTMILAGLIIALGEVVDDAIIDVENILRRLRIARQEGDLRSTPRIILEASLEVRSSIIHATFISLAAIAPVFLLRGLTASFFRPLALAYTLAILASLAVALTVTPALCLLFLRRAPLERQASPLVAGLRRGYSGVLARIVARPVAAYATFGLVVLLGVLIVPRLGESLFPTFKQRDLLIHWDAIPGTSDAEVVRTTASLSKQLLAVPGVTSFGAHIGRAAQGEEIVGINAAEIWIHLDNSVDYDKTVATVRRIINQYPGLYRDVETYLNERIEEVLTGAKQAIEVRIYGQDLAEMRSEAAAVLKACSDVPGTVDQHVDLSVDTPQLQVEVNLPKAARYGLKPGDVRRQVAAMIAGQEMGNVFADDKIYGVYVWSIPSVRANASAIGELLLDTPAGGRVPLATIASVTMRSDPYLVTRENGSRYIDVGANVQGRNLSTVVNDIRTRLKTVRIAQGSHYELLGEYNERQAAEHRLFATAIVAIVAIFLMLQLSFDSWRLATFVFFTLPMSLVGGVIAIFIAGGVVSVGALVGFFTVFGIAARNGILLINHCQHLEQFEGETFGPALVVRGARERLAPILMTSLATGLALVPLLFNGDQPGHEIEYPLAVVIIGGLFTSTLLNLLVVPSLYLRFGRAKAGDTAAG
jgi:CzcA family heavy metal efflux pump